MDTSVPFLITQETERGENPMLRNLKAEYQDDEYSAYWQMNPEKNVLEEFSVRLLSKGSYRLVLKSAKMRDGVDSSPLSDPVRRIRGYKERKVGGGLVL